MGFDEVQFDYVRFPDKRGLVFSKPNTEENRVAAINGLLAAARKKLEPYNVFLAADIFGYVCWNLDDTEIGQRIVDVMQHVDYASPMLYPSGFQFGIPGYRDPVVNSHEIIYRSLERARVRANVARRALPSVAAGVQGLRLRSPSVRTRRKSSSRSARPNASARMAGCCGIRAMYTMQRLSKVRR